MPEETSKTALILFEPNGEIWDSKLLEDKPVREQGGLTNNLSQYE